MSATKKKPPLDADAGRDEAGVALRCAIFSLLLLFCPVSTSNPYTYPKTPVMHLACAPGAAKLKIVGGAWRRSGLGMN